MKCSPFDANANIIIRGYFNLILSNSHYLFRYEVRNCDVCLFIFFSIYSI